MPQNPGNPDTYFLLLPNGEEEGPYTLRELKEMLQQDLIAADSQVRSSACGCPLHLDELLHDGQVGTLDEITGLDGLRGFSLVHFFADVFRRHTKEEVLNGDVCFTCDCEVSIFNTVAVQAAELRERLRKYEEAENAH